jgi:hypothetical protein
MGRMNTRTIGLILAVCISAGTTCFADNAQMGTWKLNEAKTKLAPRMGKNSTVVYKSSWFGDDVKVTVDGTDRNGKPAHNTWSGRFDGKFYPVVGDPTSDARAYKVVDDHTMDIKVANKGHVTSSGRIVVSADGKSRTITLMGRDAKGKKFKSKGVYDKQS